MSKTLTLQDIADKAGISLTTASMYINGKAGKYNISKATCERIANVIAENNYNPNIHARAIAGKKTYLIGVIIAGGIDSSFWLDIVAGIEEKITPCNYHMILSVSHYDVETERKAIEFMNSKGVDGFIYSPAMPDANFDIIEKLKKKKPFVSITLPIPGIPSVYNDNAAGGEAAAKCLFDNGHRKIAYIGQLKNWGDPRGVSFVKILKNKGVSVTVFSDVNSFMPKVRDFTAVFCFSDYQVLDLYNEAAKIGIKIPDDLSVIGYDNMSFIQYLSPRPATIHQYKKELGSEAADIMMARLEKNEILKDKVFTPKLIESSSIRRWYE
ncbi:MAG: hypothetical protein A2020_05605 [Lentisphaerae bacterium GWF2_45_14]|nr:MAG: hypothetical protein A2020_05605 [Lentisphaerae bacterium GWF2_45_14]